MRTFCLILCCIVAGFIATAQAQDLNKPFGWASLNGGTTGSGISSPSEVTAETPNVHYPTTEAEFQAALNTARKAPATTIIIKSGITISFIEGTKVDSKAKNISILGEYGARFHNPSGDNGILNIKGYNVILRNIIFAGPGAIDVDGDDPLSIESATNVWVDHCTFYDGRDGNLDIKEIGRASCRERVASPVSI